MLFPARASQRRQQPKTLDTFFVFFDYTGLFLIFAIRAELGVQVCADSCPDKTADIAKTSINTFGTE
jgi:hypothetical protein